MGRKSKRKQNPDKDEQAKADRKELVGLCSSILEVAMRPAQVTAAKQWEEFQQLHDLVEKIRKKQQDELFKNHKREEKKGAFVAWLKENDVDIESTLSIKKYGEEGYGLTALTDIKAKDMFLAIPRKLMITDSNVAESEMRHLVKSDRILSTMPHVALGVYLLSEKLSGQSFWKPYIDFLPSTYNIPLYFTPDELQELQGSPTFGEALKQYKNIARQYAYFYKTFQGNADVAKFFDRDRFTYDSYRWAVSTIMSRQNQVPSKDGSHLVTALIPGWDLLNHCNGCLTTGYNMQRETSESLAEKDHSPGEQIRMFYGARPNSHFLLFMGFVFPDNHHDSVNVQLGVSKNDRLYAMKSQLLAMLGMNDLSHSFYIRYGEEPIPAELLTFLRVFSMNDEQLRVRLLENRHLIQYLIKPNCIVSKRNEMKVWAYLDIRLRLLLQQYKSYSEEDESRLKDTKLSSNARLCILQLQCEKLILESTIDYISMKKEIVENLPDDALSYTPVEDPPKEEVKLLPEPPLASEEDSDINTLNGCSENSRESDFEDAPEDETNGDADSEVVCNSQSDSLSNEISDSVSKVVIDGTGDLVEQTCMVSNGESVDHQDTAVNSDVNDNQNEDSSLNQKKHENEIIQNGSAHKKVEEDETVISSSHKGEDLRESHLENGVADA